MLREFSSSDSLVHFMDSRFVARHAPLQRRPSVTSAESRATARTAAGVPQKTRDGDDPSHPQPLTPPPDGALFPKTLRMHFATAGNI